LFIFEGITMPTLVPVDKMPPPEPQSILYRLPVEQRGEEKIAIEEERSWRILFLDRHNETAAKLACSMFPQLVQFKTKVEFDMYKVAGCPNTWWESGQEER
jgi:hypothetical protein